MTQALMLPFRQFSKKHLLHLWSSSSSAHLLMISSRKAEQLMRWWIGSFDKRPGPVLVSSWSQFYQLFKTSILSIFFWNSNACCTVQVSISPTYKELLLRQFFCAKKYKPKIEVQKSYAQNFCMKNLFKKCWWNWLQLLRK